MSVGPPRNGSASALAEPQPPTTSSHDDQHVARHALRQAVRESHYAQDRVRPARHFCTTRTEELHRPCHKQWPATGLGHATPINKALGSNMCTFRFSPLEYKREGLGQILGRTGRKKNTPIELHTTTLLENNVSNSQHHPRRDLGLAPSLT